MLITVFKLDTGVWSPGKRRELERAERGGAGLLGKVRRGVPTKPLGDPAARAFKPAPNESWGSSGKEVPRNLL